jgi:hypothetical protein
MTHGRSEVGQSISHWRFRLSDPSVECWCDESGVLFFVFCDFPERWGVFSCGEATKVRTDPCGGVNWFGWQAQMTRRVWMIIF